MSMGGALYGASSAALCRRWRSDLLQVPGLALATISNTEMSLRPRRRGRGRVRGPRSVLERWQLAFFLDVCACMVCVCVRACVCVWAVGTLSVTMVAACAYAHAKERARSMALASRHEHERWPSPSALAAQNAHEPAVLCAGARQVLVLAKVANGATGVIDGMPHSAHSRPPQAQRPARSGISDACDLSPHVFPQIADATPILATRGAEPPPTSAPAECGTGSDVPFRRESAAVRSRDESVRVSMFCHFISDSGDTYVLPWYRHLRPLYRYW